MMTLDIIGHVLEDVYFPTGTEYSWEVDYDAEAKRFTFETTAGAVQNLVEYLIYNYPDEWRQGSRITDELQYGYDEWYRDDCPTSEDDLDQRYIVDVSHLIEEEHEGWTLHLRVGYGWVDFWQSLCHPLYVPIDMTEAELRKAIADTLGPARSFMHPRQLED